MSAPAATPLEKPLSRPARLSLMLSAAAMIILFYLFVLVAGAAILVIFLVEMVVVICAARFGLAGFLIKYPERHLKLMGLLTGALWLRQHRQFRVKMDAAEAPGLQDTLEHLATRLNIAPPDAIYLEMNAGAWVELTGLRREIGRTNVGVGYDLLAALTVQEVEAVMAHELAHAKLVKRAFKRWLNGGLGRAGKMMNQVTATAYQYRKENKSFLLAEIVLRTGDILTATCARLVYTYSRQDEFDADRGAMALCGAAPLRSALQKLEALESRLSRLPWNERVAQIQSDEGLSQWLVQELTVSSQQLRETAENDPAVHNPYSTHPSLRDRLAVLADDGSTLQASPIGLTMLAEPDAMAKKLAGEIERMVQEAEAKDDRVIKKWLKKKRRGRTLQIRHAQIPAVLVFTLSVIFTVGSLAVESWVIAGFGLVGMFFLTPFLMRLGRYRDPRPLPIPTYEALIAARKNLPDSQKIEGLQKEIEKNLREAIAGEKRKKRKVNRLAEEGFAALGAGDYLRAHVAGRLSLELNKQSLEGAMVMAIAAGAFQQTTVSDKNLRFLLAHTAWRTPAIAWGTAWTFILISEWAPAEALLQELISQNPAESSSPTLRTLLALAQSRRGKLQSALNQLRQIPDSQPPRLEQEKLFCQLLLNRGYINEANNRLQRLVGSVQDEHDWQLLMVRLFLLRKNTVEAEHWVERLAPTPKTPGDPVVSMHLNLGPIYLELGKLFEVARADARAMAFYQSALDTAHYPEARHGLARLKLHTKDFSTARSHILSSLDSTKPIGSKGLNAFAVFNDSLNLLLALEEPVTGCKAWLGQLAKGFTTGPLGERRLVIYARDTEAAKEFFLILAHALEPTQPARPREQIKIAAAPPDMQPARPVRPGVQFVFS